MSNWKEKIVENVSMRIASKNLASIEKAILQMQRSFTELTKDIPNRANENIGVTEEEIEGSSTIEWKFIILDTVMIVQSKGESLELFRLEEINGEESLLGLGKVVFEDGLSYLEMNGIKDYFNSKTIDQIFKEAYRELWV